MRGRFLGSTLQTRKWTGKMGSKKLGVLAVTTLIIGLLLPVAPSVASASTLWVNNAVGLTLSAPGTSCAAPGYASIAAAVTAASSGDTIRVCSGTYSESITISKSLTLLGAQTGTDPQAGGRAGGETIMDAGYPFNVNASNVTISGFELINWDQAIAITSGAFVGANSYTVSDVTLSYNYMHQPNSNGRYGILTEQSAGTESNASLVANLNINHNLVAGAKAAAIGLGGYNDAHSAVFSNLRITNNDLAAEGGYGIFVGANPAFYEINGFTATGNYLHSDSNSANFNLGNIQGGTFSNNLISTVRGTIGISTGAISGNTFIHGGALNLWGSVFGFTRPSQNLDVTNNLFADEVNGRGLMVDSYGCNTFGAGYVEGDACTFVSGARSFSGYGHSSVDSSTINLSSNSFANRVATGDRVRNLGTTQLTADANWWGDATGRLDGTQNVFGDVAQTSFISSYTADPAKQVAPSAWPLSVAGELSTEPGFWPIDTTVTSPVAASASPTTVTVTDPTLGAPALTVASSSAGASVSVSETANPSSPASTPFTVDSNTKFIEIVAPNTTGPYKVCINGTAPSRLFHYEAGAWVDITGRDLTPGSFPAGQLCGMTNTLSPFVTAGPRSELSVLPVVTNITYGDPIPTFNFTLSDGTNTVDLSGDSSYVAPVCSSTYVHGSNAGDYDITCSGGSADSYTFDTSATATLHVAKRHLTITAVSKSINFGDATPSLTYTTDLHYGDSLISAPVCTTTYVHGDAAGTYPITCTGANAGANYESTVTYIAGNLYVDQMVVLITAADATVTYGDPAPTKFGFTAALHGTDKLTKDPVCVSSYAPGSPVGDYPITCSGAEVPSNYITPTSYTAGTLHVTARQLVITASNVNLEFGADAPASYAATANLYGSDKFVTAPVCSSTYVKGSKAGEYPITCTGGSAGINYSATPTHISGTLRVGAYGVPVTALTFSSKRFNVTSSNSSKTVKVRLTANLTADFGACSASGPSVTAGTVAFRDIISGKLLASKVAIQAVDGKCGVGVASTVVTLSTSTGNVNSYLIAVELAGALSGNSASAGGQIDTDPASATVLVSRAAPKTHSTYGAGTLGRKLDTNSLESGTHGTLVGAMKETSPMAFALGFGTASGAKKASGQAVMLIPGPGASVYLVKSYQVVRSKTAAGVTTLDLKANVRQVGCTTGCVVAKALSLRIQAKDAGELIAFTLQSPKHEVTYFASDWYFNGKVWSSRLQPASGAGKYLKIR